MPRIRILSDDLINQIAAGEVIERPASVVKELAENALDAGAGRVSVTIEEGGIRLIAVTDDGEGMSRADAELAFARHATSKLRSASDLAAVATLGFRGEALPSIASVARVRMLTRREQDAVGVELEGDGNGIRSVRDAACPAGTTVEVAELFARVPARRKFLKTSATEATQVLRLIERLALVRTDVRFDLVRDGKPILSLPPTASAKERVIAVLPPRASERLVPVEGEMPTLRVTGFASPTDVLRGTTADIHLFVNARPVRDRLLLHAVREAYRDALPPGRHPVAVLWLNVDPAEVDVNVHPAKQEVRFRDPRAVGRLLRTSLGRAAGVRERPSATGWSAADAPRARYDAPRAAELLAPADRFLGGPTPQAVPTGAPAAAEAAPRPPFVFRALRFVGQVMATYLLFERAGSPQRELVLIDQHAAHERVLFERLRAALRAGDLPRQSLLVPIRVELPPGDAEALREADASLAHAGFELEHGDTTLRGHARITVRAVPALLAARGNVDHALLLEETAALLRDPAGAETRAGLEAVLHGVLATAACHSATRKGDRLAPEQVDALLAALDETIWFPNCPHGRPFVSVLDEADLERRFLRR